MLTILIEPQMKSSYAKKNRVEIPTLHPLDDDNKKYNGSNDDF